MSEILYFETGSTDPHYNLAFEEYVHVNYTEGTILMLWQNANSIIIGRNQNTLEEIDREFVVEHDISVVRRNTGGGAVYHDLGNLNYSFITDAKDGDGFSRFTEPVVAALRGLGLDAEASGRNDILVSGRKVSGTAQRIINGRVLHHGTLLFDSDGSMVSRSLRPDPLKIKSHGVQSVRSRIGNIREFLQDDMTINEFWDHIKSTLSGPEYKVCVLSEAELAEVKQLKESKYDTWDWNYGHSPEFEIKNRRKYPAGILDVRLNVRNGYIKDIAIYGDFMAAQPVDGCVERLKGCRYKRDEVLSALGDVPDFPEVFGGLTVQEVCDTMFPVSD